jgi:hypothetical protein
MPSIGASDYVGSLLKVFAKPFQDQETLQQVHKVVQWQATSRRVKGGRRLVITIGCFFLQDPHKPVKINHFKLGI